MRLATLKDGRAVAILNERAVALDDLGFKGSLQGLIEAGPDALTRLQEALNGVRTGRAVKLEDYDAPLKRPSKVVAIGLNYLDHASESKMELPKNPLVFTKFPSSITGPRDPVVLPASLTEQVDYEVELGVVIGRVAKGVPEEQALAYVFGYTVLNDVSARDLQFADGQWVRGKSLDTFCPMGPVIVTADDIPDPQALELGCEVNGETLQNASTKDMIFGVAELISRLSQSFTLEPGDIIATGTPSGVGFSRRPPLYLKPGDTMRTWVKGIGELVNPVVAA
ncbi:MAG: fumarylacetoacetate hydrolase family protein [Deinococcota bacterium]|nr:fumarylacetoacetate hydrolase family protein [Deinococcota bacterium]